VLDEIFEDHDIKKILFFGDDSQYDLDIYHHFADKFPDSVLGIFIHRTKGLEGKKEVRWKMDIENSLKKVHFYSHFEEIYTPLNQILDEITIRS
jgi:phosphatidate phosphatase APP1